MREERSVGQFAGFDLDLSIPAASDDSPCFVLKGRRAYAAHHSDTPQGMLRVIENVANSLAGRLSDANDDLVRAEKRLADILIELAKPFDKAARLTSLRLRQREINAETFSLCRFSSASNMSFGFLATTSACRQRKGRGVAGFSLAAPGFFRFLRSLGGRRPRWKIAVGCAGWVGVAS